MVRWPREDLPASANMRRDFERRAGIQRVVGMADGCRQRVCGVGLWWRGKPQQPRHHVLHLDLGGLAIANDGLLDLQGGVLGNRQPVFRQRGENRASRLSQQQRGLRIDVDEYLFNDSFIWLVTRHDLAYARKKCGKPRWQAVARVGADTAAGEVAQMPSVFFENAEARGAQSWINAEDAQ